MIDELMIDKLINMKVMKNRIMVMIMAAVFALPAMAGWINHQQKNCTEQENAFQSTSTMQGSGSAYSATPAALNEDGTVGTPLDAARGPRRMRQDDEADDEIGISTPGKTGSEAPIGDAVLPLMLMAAAGAGIIALRRRKAAVK